MQIYLCETVLFPALLLLSIFTFCIFLKEITSLFPPPEPHQQHRVRNQQVAGGMKREGPQHITDMVERQLYRF